MRYIRKTCSFPMTCNVCGNTLGPRPYQHEKRCAKRQAFIVANRDEIFRLYSDGVPAYEIGRRFRIGSSIYRYLRMMGVDVRGVKESVALPLCKQRRAVSNYAAHGATHNFCNSSSARTAQMERMFVEEGITNVFQRLDVKCKSKQTLLARYGVDHPMRSKSIALKMSRSRGGRHGKPFGQYSKPHALVVEYLRSVGVHPVVEYMIETPDRNYFFDVKVGDLLIEVNGDYWHCNPRRYKVNDRVSFYGRVVEAGVVWAADARKTTVAVSAGYRTLTVWEYDIISDFKSVKKIIDEAIGRQEH